MLFIDFVHTSKKYWVREKSEFFCDFYGLRAVDNNDQPWKIYFCPHKSFYSMKNLHFQLKITFRDFYKWREWKIGALD